MGTLHLTTGELYLLKLLVKNRLLALEEGSSAKEFAIRLLEKMHNVQFPLK